MQRPNIDACKLLALGTMLVDHVGVLLMPEALALRLVGRLAFPLFVCTLGYNWLHHTADRWAYVRRLLYVAVVAQPAYAWAFDTWRLNILFTLGLGLAAATWAAGDRWRIIGVMAGAAMVTLIEYLVGGTVTSYGGVGLFAVVCAAFGRWPLVGFLVALANLKHLTPAYSVMGMLAALAVALFAVSVWLPWRPGRWVRNRWLWYAFYPGHLAALAAVAAFVEG
ncbi:MAG: TraX family protein [Phycisphaeraceae bacterium]